MSFKGISFLFCLVKDCVWNINWYSKRFYKPKTYFDEQKYFKTWQGYNKMCLMILDLPKDFGWVPIVLDGFNLLWLDPNYFGQVQIIKISPEKSNLNLTKMIWTRPKQFGPDQNNLDNPKSFLIYRRDKAQTSLTISAKEVNIFAYACKSDTLSMLQQS